jgi:NIMA (never in mitosis gene a)-related kinase
MNLFIQMVIGIQYLHQYKVRQVKSQVVHRDIKPHNIFINEDGVVKLADFGISKALDRTTEKALTLVGTPYYLSPEACKNEGYDNKSDVWALGCVLYELATLKVPH